ncbi:DUF1385 domain-containing protein [Candidatus Woesearchaeota archaeon]|nr:DUF1385 domain-containing protein [Candidatus Woesearchaeota archaeon]
MFKDIMEKVGGQAVIEGVMMRRADDIAVAVRLPDGKIKVRKDSLKKRKGFWKKPFFRGIINLWDMMYIGVKALLWSADQQLDEHEKITKKEIGFTLAVTILFALLLFKGVPYLVASLLGLKEAAKPLLFNVVDGVMRGLIIFGYMLVIAQFKDVRRIFQYHGAEHKAIYCYEAGKKLDVKNVSKYSTKHPRCGTSFIILVLAIAIVMFALLSLLIPLVIPGFRDLSLFYQILISFPIRVLFLFPIAGISYELLKLTAKYPKNIVVKAISWPGLLLQKITTKEPSKKQIEVAIKALKAVLG